MAPTRHSRFPQAGENLFWRHFLWSLLFPKRAQKVSATLPGSVLIALAVGIGAAAYNSANNILFITLSLLLGCLLLSGVLSWLNFRKLRWWLELDTPMRAGRSHPAAVHVQNGKRLLPVHGLIFEVRGSSAPQPRELHLRGRIDPGDEARLVWQVQPLRRGLERVELLYIGSLFPFGFLRKSIAAKIACDVLVWPAPVEYRRFPVPAWRHAQTGERVRQEGQGSDLLALRDYRHGDSHRRIHWKASARRQRLVVRQFSDENEQRFVLWLAIKRESWPRAEQFETLCSFAGTLAEDLFKQGRLEAVVVGRSERVAVKGVRDLEAFLDALAVLTSEQAEIPASASAAQRNLLTFSPEGMKGVAAYIDGKKAAST